MFFLFEDLVFKQYQKMARNILKVRMPPMQN